MKAVTPHAFLVEAFGQRVIVRQRAVATVKRGVETGDLRQLGTAVKKRPDRSKVVRLMQRRQRDVAFELHRNLPQSARTGPVEVGASVNNPMSDGEEIDLLSAAQPVPRQLAMAAGTSGILSALYVWSTSDFLSAPSAFSRGRLPTPSIWPLTRQSSSPPEPPVANTWNFTLDEPALTTRMVSMVNHAAGIATVTTTRIGVKHCRGARGEAAPTVSARDVRMTGTRAPRTIPAASAFVKEKGSSPAYCRTPDGEQREFVLAATSN